MRCNCIVLPMRRLISFVHCDIRVLSKSKEFRLIAASIPGFGMNSYIFNTYIIKQFQKVRRLLVPKNLFL